MAIRTVLQLGDPRLREIAYAVENPTDPTIRSLVQDLSDTLAYWRQTTGYGRAIAAPQLGVKQRVIFLQLPGAEPWPMINPEIIERSKDTMIVWDCLPELLIHLHAG